MYHTPSENVPLKSEIFTKNIKEWPIEILNELIQTFYYDIEKYIYFFKIRQIIGNKFK
jgi:hypothetical protein